MHESVRNQFEQLPTHGFGGKVSRELASRQNLSTPPAAEAPKEQEPQRLSGMPLPIGAPIKASSLLPEELSLLSRLGWQQGDPVPSNLPDILAEVEKDNQEVSLPADVKPIPKEQNVVDIDQLPPEKIAEIKASLEDAKKFQPPTNTVADAAPGVNELISGQGVRKINLDIKDDRKEPAAEATPLHAKDDVSGLSAPMTNCPQCHFDLSMPSVPDPDLTDRRRYLQAVLGGKSFVKEYGLFDGELRVAFRELTTQELDVTFKCANLELQKDEAVHSQLELLNLVMRFRLCLQLKSLRSADGNLNIERPDSLKDWTTHEIEPEKVLLAVEKFTFEEVVKNESLFRALHQAMMRFNRLVTKLESSAYRENFWKATQ